MKQKKDYSMTARQRKEQRQREAAKKAESENVPVSEEERATAEVAEKRVRRSKWVLAAAIVVGAMLILTAVLLPVLLLRAKSKYPVAKITFSTGDVVRMEIWEETCPITATNFLFLARSGFFTRGNGNLMYDTQNDFMRFGALLSYKNKDTRFEDTEFVNGLDIRLDEVSYESVNKEKNKTGYSLRADSDPDLKRSSQLGVVSYLSNSPADFVINLEEGNTKWYSENPGIASNPRYNFNGYIRSFGKIFDEDIDTMRKIYAYGTGENSGSLYYKITDPQVYIRSIRFDNLDGKKWNGKFNFAQFMNTVVEGGAWAGWRAYN